MTNYNTPCFEDPVMNDPVWNGMTDVLADPTISCMQVPDACADDAGWEDWLRWEPAVDAASPENDTAKSSSSKDVSPRQEHVLPYNNATRGKGSIDDTLAPPLVMGEDMADFTFCSIPAGPTSDVFMFGDLDEVKSGFEFGNIASGLAMQEPGDGSVANPYSSTFTTDVGLNKLSLQAPPTSVNIHTQLSPMVDKAGPLSSTWHEESPQSASQDRTSPSSNSSSSPSHELKSTSKKRGGRKRKAVVEEENQESGQFAVSTGEDDEPPMKKTSHNVIEKRYRNNLNDKIVELRNSVPSLRALGKAHGGEDSEDLEGLTPAHKLNKATVMGKATEYIKHLEKRNKSMSDEMAALKARLAAVEAAIGRTSESANTSNNVRSRQPSTASQSGRGLLHVPDQGRFIQTSIQSQFRPLAQHQPSAYTPTLQAASMPHNQAARHNQRRGAGLINKIAMGGMAGLMVMEGFMEQQDDSHALFAIPTELVRRGPDSDTPDFTAKISTHGMLPLLKGFAVIAVLLYLIWPLFHWRSTPKSIARSTVRLPHAPSLASPVEVRRKAWLTAIQTVYTRKHFLLEVVSVATKMALLYARRLIGPETYRSLTGTTKEEEAARIKAWDIAIDAQLAGGDAEVSYYRLLLTLMASGTLPDSPARLMQKAVHFRVFFWEVANAGYGNIFGFRQLTENVGKFYWDSARRLHKEYSLGGNRDQSHDDDDERELLPDHLASLVELDCDEVLNDEMVQRAWNLAWNKPSAFGTTGNCARDRVVEDHAIRSPLDAVAAWYAHMTIDDALLDTLGGHPSTWDADYCIGIAVSVAPSASATQGRAYAAKAVVSNMNRDANIVAALDALPLDQPPAGTMNLVSHAPAAPEIRTALTLAKLLSLMPTTSDSMARARGQDMIARMRLMPESLTLLSAVAVYRLLKIVITDRQLDPFAMRGIEDMAASLRLWTGTTPGQCSGLAEHESVCGHLVDTCLEVARKFGGWDERDSAYGSAAVSPARSHTSTAGLRY